MEPNNRIDTNTPRNTGGASQQNTSNNPNNGRRRYYGPRNRNQNRAPRPMGTGQNNNGQPTPMAQGNSQGQTRNYNNRPRRNDNRQGNMNNGNAPLNLRGGGNSRGRGGQQRRSPGRNDNRTPVPMTQPQKNNIYFTANALNWGNNSSYQFRETDPSKIVKIIPVSGLEMVGTNCTVFEHENDIVIIDAGLGFPGSSLPGIDSLIPNLNFLEDRKQNIKGLVITHGHTDHIGGVPYVIEKLGFPMIFAPKLAAELIKEKLKEFNLAEKVKITEINGDSSYYLGKFRLSHFKMTHTIPDNYGVVLDTPVGRVVCTSDYKFDSAPYKESPSDYSKLAKLGDEGVLLLLDESTNAKKQGWADSETTIAKDIDETIRTANGRVMIGMFSTMVNRVRQIVEIAAKYNKKVAVFGRSLETIVKITHNQGYIDVTSSVFVPQDQIDQIPDDQLIILTTGSQGEANAALMRMAQGIHAKLKLRSSDTIVFSSSRIPGNEEDIDNLINMLTMSGCRILTSDYLTFHATGHGYKEDHKLMLRLVKPRFMMPVHGEPSMLRAHKDTALELGYADQNIIMAHDGMILELTADGWRNGGAVETKPLWVESNRVGDFDESIIEERKMLTDEGAVFIAVKNLEKNTIEVEDVSVVHKGFFVQRKDDFMNRQVPALVKDIVNGFKVEDRQKDTVRASIQRRLENDLQRQYEKQPLIVVTVL